MGALSTRQRAPTASRIPRSGIRETLEQGLGSGVYDLAAGDPAEATPSHVISAAQAAMLAGHTHYTDGRGMVELRAAFAAKLLSENGFSTVDPDTEVVITAGALNALAATFLSVVAPGDRVLIPDPGFANYRAQVLLADGVPVSMPYPARLGHMPDLEWLRANAATARVLVLNTPNNPTGAILPEAVLREIAEIAVRYDLMVVADEVYECFVYDQAAHTAIGSFDGLADRTITIMSVSKCWAMTGWRIGFAAGPAAVMATLASVQEHLIGCPSSIGQWAALAALSGPPAPRDQIVRALAGRRELLIEGLQGLPGITLVRPQGAFYAFPVIDEGIAPGPPARTLLEEAGVLTVPGTAFGDTSDRHVRLSFAGDEEQLRAALARIAAWAHSAAR
jgi:aminotransferase